MRGGGGDDITDPHRVPLCQQVRRGRHSGDVALLWPGGRGEAAVSGGERVMSEPYWATGPGEILRHGMSLLEIDSDSNRRLAMISIDNSVELMMQTFIQLPKRVTGVDIQRAKRDEICSGFPKLLDGIEEHASQLVQGLDLGVIEWFHRLRNQLYHQGNGLTVERTKVEAYAELARKLFRGLYGVDLQLVGSKDMKKLGEFLDGWIEIEKGLQKAAKTERVGSVRESISKLISEEKISPEQATQINELSRVRNELVHGTTEPSKALSPQVLRTIVDVSRWIASLY